MKKLAIIQHQPNENEGFIRQWIVNHKIHIRMVSINDEIIIFKRANVFCGFRY